MALSSIEVILLCFREMLRNLILCYLCRAIWVQHVKSAVRLYVFLPKPKEIRAPYRLFSLIICLTNRYNSNFIGAETEFIRFV